MIHTVGPSGEVGVFSDTPDLHTPPNAWTSGQNVVFEDKAARAAPGYAEAYTPSVAPHYAEFVQTSSGNFWVYLSLTKAYATNGTTHADITRATGGDYAATVDKNWTSAVLGGILILNNEVDLPQMWLNPGLANQLSALSNWPAGVTCRSLRAFKNFLVALNVTESGTAYPHMVRWSHPADPGAVPASWDYTDTTKDAGRIELRETSDSLVDQAPLKGVNILYREGSVYSMQYIGGQNVFRFDKIFGEWGILTKRCAAEFVAGKHVVFCKDDIVVHDGIAADSVVDSRTRKKIFTDIDSTNFPRSFIFVDRTNKEVFFCYPQRGASLPNTAAVWSWKSNTWGFRDIPLVAHAAVGEISFGASGPVTWNAATSTWEDASLIWDVFASTAREKKTLWCVPGATKLYGYPYGNGVGAATLERTGLGLPVKSDGPPDFTSRKQVARLWPHISGEVGTTIDVYIGGQDSINQPVSWKPPKSFVIGSQTSVDCTMNARLHAVRFLGPAGKSWKISAFDVEIYPAGSK